MPAQLAQRASSSAVQDVLALEDDLARGGLDQPGQAAHQRGLAGAGQAHDDEDLAGGDVEAARRGRRRRSRSAPSAPCGCSAHSSGDAGTLAAFGPNTFHRLRTEMTGSTAVPASGPAAALVLGIGCIGASPRARGDADGRAQPLNQSLRPGSDVLPDVLGLAVLRQAGRSQLAADARTA